MKVKVTWQDTLASLLCQAVTTLSESVLVIIFHRCFFCCLTAVQISLQNFEIPRHISRMAETPSGFHQRGRQHYHPRGRCYHHQQGRCHHVQQGRHYYHQQGRYPSSHHRGRRHRHQQRRCDHYRRGQFHHTQQERRRHHHQPAYYSPVTFKRFYLYLSEVFRSAHKDEEVIGACWSFQEYYDACDTLKRLCTNKEERKWYKTEKANCLGFRGMAPIPVGRRLMQQLMDQLCKQAVQKMLMDRPRYARWQPSDYYHIWHRFSLIYTEGIQEFFYTTHWH